MQRAQREVDMEKEASKKGNIETRVSPYLKGELPEHWSGLPLSSWTMATAGLDQTIVPIFWLASTEVPLFTAILSFLHGLKYSFHSPNRNISSNKFPDFNESSKTRLGELWQAPESPYHDSGSSAVSTAMPEKPLSSLVRWRMGFDGFEGAAFEYDAAKEDLMGSSVCWRFANTSQPGSHETLSTVDDATLSVTSDLDDIDSSRNLDRRQ
jgi:hypothetical protein